MTRIQIQLPLSRPLDNALLERIRDAHAIYGIESIRVDPAEPRLTVNYDATRLRANDVSAALKRCGVPVQ